MSPRSFLLAGLFTAASLFPCYGQNDATFTSTNTLTSARSLRNTYSVDVNNDGVPDIIMDTINLPNAFSVFLANGDGTFSPGYSYTFPTQYQGVIPMVSGDFNGDGNVDLIFELAGTNQLAVFLGNGDGSFQSPMYESITLPSGQWFGGSPIVTADFTGDGTLDLVSESNDNSASNMVIIPGQGNGQFSTATSFYTPPLNHGVGTGLTIGDFDGDGLADIAYLETYNCVPGNCASLLHIDYGTGAGTFNINEVYSSGNTIQFATGDLNDDAHTDIFGFDGQGSPAQLITLYGQSDRTVALYSQSAGVSDTALLTGPVMANFNGDGFMDIAAISQDSSGSSVQMYLGTSSLGQFRQQSIASQGTGTPVVGDFNSDTKPDIVYVISGGNTAGPPPNIVTELNTTSGTFTNCAYLSKGSGINVCQPPASTDSPAQFVITANSYGQLRKIEVWVDGNKIGEQWHTWGHSAWFNMSNSVSSGTHNATVYAADVDNRLQRYDFSFTVGSAGSCAAPSSPGVNVCSPANGSFVPSPVTVTAAANIVGTLARMEIWVDGVKMYTETTSTSFTTSVPLADGYHRFDIYAVNTNETKYETTVYATVGSATSCPADPGFDVHVCSPISSSTVSSPVQALAAAHITGSLARMEVWVDGVKEYTETNSLTLSASIPLPSGEHQFDFYAVNTSETKWETTVFASVP